MHTVESLIKKLLADSPALGAVLLLIAMLEEQRNELLEEIRRMAAQPQPSISIDRYEDIVRRNARLETAIIGIYAILNVNGDPVEQVVKIAQLVDEVAVYKTK